MVAINRLKEPAAPSDAAGFKPLFFRWVWKKAGGLSVSKAGGDKDAHGAPITVTVNGKTYKNPHTNHDVQWDTYKYVAPLVGLNPSADSFVHMTYGQWLKIADHIIFGNGNQFTDNPVLAAYIGSWYWGSGSISQANVDKIKAIVNGPGDGLHKIKKLVDLRIAHFVKLGKDDPQEYEESTVASWIKRAKSFLTNFGKFA